MQPATIVVIVILLAYGLAEFLRSDLFSKKYSHGVNKILNWVRIERLSQGLTLVSAKKVMFWVIINTISKK